MLANGEQKIQQLLQPENTPSRKDCRHHIRVETLQITPQSQAVPNLLTGVGHDPFQTRGILESVGVFLPA